MKREFIALVGGVTTWPLTARAQQTGQHNRVALIAGVIGPPAGAGPDGPRCPGAARRATRFQRRSESTMDYLSKPVTQFALGLADMVRAKPDVIVTSGAEFEFCRRSCRSAP